MNNFLNQEGLKLLIKKIKLSLDLKAEKKHEHTIEDIHELNSSLAKIEQAIPTKTSQLENNSSFVTQEELTNELSKEKKWGDFVNKEEEVRNEEDTEL